MTTFNVINRDPDAKTLRQFGYVAVAGFGVLALFAWKERALFAAGLGAARPIVTGVLLALAASCLLFSVAYPRGNRPVYLGLSFLTYPIGLVSSYVILAVLFVFVFGPAALIMRLVGRDALTRRHDDSAPSYWVKRRVRRSENAYFRQY